MNKYNQEVAEKTLAVYETSTDYDRLHELAKQGYRIPCFLYDKFGSGDVLYFRVATCFLFGNTVEICEVGRCFIDDMAGMEHFKKQCEKLEVRFIMPNFKEPSQ